MIDDDFEVSEDPIVLEPSFRQIKDFVLELEELCKRYRIYIGGCGCCGSPFLEAIAQDKLHNSGYILGSKRGESEIIWKDNKYACIQRTV